MSYFYDAFDEYVIINKSIVDDGEGGYTTSWSDGATIKAAFDLGNASEQRQAQAQNLKRVYSVTFPKRTPVKYGDYLRKVETGEIYRITSDPTDNKTPDMARNQTCFATAERTELPQ